MPTLALAFACRFPIVLDAEPWGDESHLGSEEYLAKASTPPRFSAARIALRVGCPFWPKAHGQRQEL